MTDRLQFSNLRVAVVFLLGAKRRNKKVMDDEELLRDAYDKISAAKEDLMGISESISALSNDYEDNWKGANASNVFYSCSASGELGGLYFSLIDEIDTICLELSSKIKEFSDEIYENKMFYGIED